MRTPPVKKRATELLQIAVHPHTRMEWKRLSKLVQAADFYAGRGPGACRRFIERAIKEGLVAKAAELRRMGHDPDLIVARFGLQRPPAEPAEFGRVERIIHD